MVVKREGWKEEKKGKERECGREGRKGGKVKKE